jgi:hypothetical protein
MIGSPQDPPGTASRPRGWLGRRGKLSSGVLVAVIIAAFMAGGIAMMVQEWWLFWLSAGAVIASAAGWLIKGTGGTAAGQEPSGSKRHADRPLARASRR